MCGEESSRTAPRREYLVAAASVWTAGTVSGCLGFLEDGATEFAASPSRVRQDALDRTGYEFDDIEEVVIEREFSAGGESRDVVLTNPVARHQRSVSLGPFGEQEAAVFASLTTPQVNVLGREFNPVAGMETDELAGMIQDQYATVENLQPQGETDVTIDGQATTQTRYTADAVFEDSPVELIVHISEAVELGDDFVVTVGGYPELLPGEEENVLALMEAVEAGE
ncbi:MAG: DUF6517 family protein [Halovenus sp.]